MRQDQGVSLQHLVGRKWVSVLPVPHPFEVVVIDAGQAYIRPPADYPGRLAVYALLDAEVILLQRPAAG